MRERWYPNQQGGFSADHFVPQAVAPDQALEYDNLIYACTRCNSWKRDNLVLDPCSVALGEHLCVGADGHIEALTPEAHEHVRCLGLDDPVLTEFRRRMLRTLKRLQALPDEESQAVLQSWLGFPDNLPNLPSLRPPKGRCGLRGWRAVLSASGVKGHCRRRIRGQAIVLGIPIISPQFHALYRQIQGRAR